jgi:hypothetical protein
MKEKLRKMDLRINKFQKSEQERLQHQNDNQDKSTILKYVSLSYVRNLFLELLLHCNVKFISILVNVLNICSFHIPKLRSKQDISSSTSQSEDEMEENAKALIDAKQIRSFVNHFENCLPFLDFTWKKIGEITT